MTYQQLESILGEPINRGSLAAGFPCGNEERFYEADIVNPDASTVPERPPLPDLELWKLNPERTTKLQQQTKEYWKNLSAKERRTHTNRLSANKRGKRCNRIDHGPRY